MAKSYVIGDIHGCLKELVYLLEGLPLKSSDRLVFLGDYIDRGPDSKGVLSHLIQWQQQCHQEFVFLKGNHESMFLSYLGLSGGQYGDMFLVNGGGSTLASYGVSSRSRSAEEARARVPESHIGFLMALRLYFLMDPFLCVHAGIHPLKPLNQQGEKELLWIRDEFIFKPHLLPYTVLFGHTPQKEVLFDIPYKIGLDTGLVYGNLLSCLDVQDRALYQISRGSRTVIQTSVGEKWRPVSRRLISTA